MAALDAGADDYVTKPFGIWNAPVEMDTNLLRVHLTHIRRKLEPDPTRPRYFITEPRIGYRFVE